jgi:hypothetical protein
MSVSSLSRLFTVRTLYGPVLLVKPRNQALQKRDYSPITEYRDFGVYSMKKGTGSVENVNKEGKCS